MPGTIYVPRGADVMVASDVWRDMMGAETPREFLDRCTGEWRDELYEECEAVFMRQGGGLRHGRPLQQVYAALVDHVENLAS